MKDEAIKLRLKASLTEAIADWRSGLSGDEVAELPWFTVNTPFQMAQAGFNVLEAMADLESFLEGQEEESDD